MPFVPLLLYLKFPSTLEAQVRSEDRVRTHTRSSLKKKLEPAYAQTPTHNSYTTQIGTSQLSPVKSACEAHIYIFRMHHRFFHHLFQLLSHACMHRFDAETVWLECHGMLTPSIQARLVYMPRA